MMEAMAETPADPAARTHAVSTDEPPTKKRSDFFSALINTTMNVVSSHTDTETEIQEYLGTPCMPEDSDPLSGGRSQPTFQLTKLFCYIGKDNPWIYFQLLLTQ